MPTGVTCQYNGHTFNSAIRSTVTEDPITSNDNRFVKYSKITIKISGYVTQDDAGADTIDAYMRSMRLKLQVHGKELIYKNKGYGSDLVINAPGGGGVRDTFLGPKAGALFWKPLGGAPLGGCAAFFTWEVSTCIPECESARYNPGQDIFTEVAYSTTYACDEAGLVVITTRGTAQIPLSLQADGTINANVDMFFAALVNPPSRGFLRTNSREISEDRSTCKFTITDRQVEVPYPNDVVHMDMKHRVAQKGTAAVKWDCTISGTVRMSPTADKFLAYRRFFVIAFERIAHARAVPRRTNTLPPRVDFEEDLFKNEARFTIRYTLINGTLTNIIANSGLWRPIVVRADRAAADRWDADTWVTSLAGNAQATKGVLGASFDQQYDVMVDVCHPSATRGGRRVAGDRVSLTPDELVQEMEQPGETDRDSLEPVNFMEQLPKSDGQLSEHGQEEYNPESSWISWQCEVRPVTDYKVIRHKPLAGTVNIDPITIDPMGVVQPVAEDGSDPKPGWNCDTPDIIQRTSSPSMMVHLRGFAVRLAYRINAPKLISFGGVTPVLLHEDCPETTFAMAGGVVFYKREWNLVYLLPTAPAALPLPANPFLGTDGQ